LIGRPSWLRIVLLVGCVLLGLGLVGPCMTIQPSFGPYTGWVKLLNPELAEPSTYSILGGILEMINSDSAALGWLLLAFSVAFPSVKLATLWWAIGELKRGRPGGAALWLTHHAGKFSMLDVLVVAVLVLAIKGLPGGTTITIGWGLYAFAASVVLSIIASVGVKGLEKRVETVPASP